MRTNNFLILKSSFDKNLQTKIGDFIRFYLGIILVYAGTGKIVDYGNFLIFVAHLDFLPVFIRNVSGVVPVVEILTGILLLVSDSRQAGLLVSFFHFTVVFIIYELVSLHSAEPYEHCIGTFRNLSIIEHWVFDGVLIVATGWMVVFQFRVSANT